MRPVLQNLERGQGRETTSILAKLWFAVASHAEMIRQGTPALSGGGGWVGAMLIGQCTMSHMQTLVSLTQQNPPFALDGKVVFPLGMWERDDALTVTGTRWGRNRGHFQEAC